MKLNFHKTLIKNYQYIQNAVYMELPIIHINSNIYETSSVFFTLYVCNTCDKLSKYKYAISYPSKIFLMICIKFCTIIHNE